MATAGVGLLLGVLGPSAAVSGAAPAPPVGAIDRTLPTRIPQPGGARSTAGRPSVTSAPRTASTPAKRPSASAASVPPTPAPRTSAAGPAWWRWALAGLGGLLVGVAGCFLIVRPRRPVPEQATPPARVGADAPGPASVAPAPPPESEHLARLVSSVIAARDLLDPHSVMAQRLGAALAGGGVQELAPIGRPFDPALHHAVETAPTTDPAAANRIAEVQRVGYCDAHRTIRLPDVVVFRLDAPR